VFEAELKLMLIANNEFNCPDTAYKALKIEPSREVYIPNSFTPNGDGRNDLFGPVFDGEVTSFNFLIFDRWGHIIFETVDVNEKWNGTFRNLNREPIKQDVYVYKIVFVFTKTLFFSVNGLISTKFCDFNRTKTENVPL